MIDFSSFYCIRGVYLYFVGSKALAWLQYVACIAGRLTLRQF
jgi:hypothetical protein